MSMEKSVIIIGGGLGGLFCGAFLAKEGLRVTVLEKNATIGGGLQTFAREGVEFDTGMHTVVGMREGGTIRRLCQYLGIDDAMHLRDVDGLCSDKLYYMEDHSVFEIANTREGFINSLSAYFPKEKENLKKYVDAIYEMTSHIDILHLRRSEGVSLFAHSEDFLMPADAFISRFTSDKRLQAVLAYLCPLYGGVGDRTPAYVHAILMMLYIEGASRFEGGSRRFADLLCDVICSHQGLVLTNEEVTWIEVNDRHVDEVVTRHGNEEKHFSADYYISAVHPCAMLDIMPENAFPHSYSLRLRSVPNSYSAFCMFAKLKKDAFPYLNYSEYFLNKYDQIWKFDDHQSQWPMGFLLMTPPQIHQGKYAEKVIVTAPMRFDEVRRWENTKVGHRGKDYEDWKKDCTDRLMAFINRIHPGFSSCVEWVNTASPLTIRDYYGNKEGCLYGFSKDAHNIALSQLPVVTKVKNLLLTGQSNNLHGFCGVPLTSLLTCEAILGSNYLIDKINATT